MKQLNHPQLRLFVLLSICLTSINGQRNTNRWTSTNSLTRNQRQLVIPLLPGSIDSRYDPRLSELISRDVLQFAHDLGAQLEATNPSSKSQIFSPVCLTSALALLLMGANGQTHQELSRLFNFDRDPQFLAHPYKVHEQLGMLLEDVLENGMNPARPRPQTPWRLTRRENMRSQHDQQPKEHIIRIANGVFVQNGYSLRPDYTRAAQSVYRTEVTPLDFRADPVSAKNYINRWVNEKTYGKIPQIIADDIQENTKVILASALYFKGFWENSFLASATHPSEFYPDGIQHPPIRVQMMANGGIFPYYDAREYGCQIIGFPYQGNLTTMYVIIPHDSNRQKLRQFQNSLTPEQIEDMISKMTKKTAVLVFPKLHITNTLNLKQILRTMGAQNLFTNGQADLTLLADGLKNGRPIAPVDRGTLLPNTLSSGPAFPQVRPQYQNEPIDLKNVLIFSRFGEEDNTTLNATTEPALNSTEAVPGNQTAGSRQKRAVTYKVESEFHKSAQPLRLKDLILNKRITKLNAGKKLIRSRRQALVDPSAALKNLDTLRNSLQVSKPDLFVEDIVHKVDLVINEQGTEAAAATVSYLRRSGADVVFRAETPFMILIRHDPTKLPLFYGTVYEPTDF